MVKITKEAALEYHESGRPGKIEVKPTKAYRTQTDLSLAYSPGVAFPCLENSHENQWTIMKSEAITTSNMTVVCLVGFAIRPHGISAFLMRLTANNTLYLRQLCNACNRTKRYAFEKTFPVTLLSPLSPSKKVANALYIGVLSTCHPQNENFLYIVTRA